MRSHINGEKRISLLVQRDTHSLAIDAAAGDRDPRASLIVGERNATAQILHAECGRAVATEAGEVPIAERRKIREIVDRAVSPQIRLHRALSDPCRHCNDAAPELQLPDATKAH